MIFRTVTRVCIPQVEVVGMILIVRFQQTHDEENDMNGKVIDIVGTLIGD
jgi:hypothetical protein